MEEIIKEIVLNCTILFLALAVVDAVLYIFSSMLHFCMTAFDHLDLRFLRAPIHILSFKNIRAEFGDRWENRK